MTEFSLKDPKTGKATKRIDAPRLVKEITEALPQLERRVFFNTRHDKLWTELDLDEALKAKFQAIIDAHDAAANLSARQKQDLADQQALAQALEGGDAVLLDELAGKAELSDDDLEAAIPALIRQNRVLMALVRKQQQG